MTSGREEKKTHQLLCSPFLERVEARGGRKEGVFKFSPFEVMVTLFSKCAVSLLAMNNIITLEIVFDMALIFYSLNEYIRAL